jgi:hypothetical protein
LVLENNQETGYDLVFCVSDGDQGKFSVFMPRISASLRRCPVVTVRFDLPGLPPQALCVSRELCHPEPCRNPDHLAGMGLMELNGIASRPITSKSLQTINMLT